MVAYEPNPRYPAVGGAVVHGFAAAVEGEPRLRGIAPAVLAIDGPMHLDWEATVSAVRTELVNFGNRASLIDMREHFLSFGLVEALTSTPEPCRPSGRRDAAGLSRLDRRKRFTSGRRCSSGPEPECSAA